MLPPWFPTTGLFRKTAPGAGYGLEKKRIYNAEIDEIPKEGSIEWLIPLLPKWTGSCAVCHGSITSSACSTLSLHIVQVCDIMLLL